MKIYQNQNAYDFENFPRTSSRKKYFKEDSGGQNEMCDIVKEYAKEYANEYANECVTAEAKKIAKTLFENNVSFQAVLAAVNLPEDILKQIFEDATATNK